MDNLKIDIYDASNLANLFSFHNSSYISTHHYYYYYDLMSSIHFSEWYNQII